MGGSGGAPARYAFTVRGWVALSPWNKSDVDHGILQLYLGYNPNSRLEVVSLLNIPSQAHQMYYYNNQDCPERHYPKVYLGTLQTTATNWNYDRQTGKIGRAHV